MLLLLALALESAALAAPQAGGYELFWWTVNGGGACVTGGGYSLGGTIGQPDAGALSGGSYTLAGGFWGGAATDYQVYLPLVVE